MSQIVTADPAARWTGMVDEDKRIAAEAAAAEVRPGMLVGLGTGSTAAHAIRAIGARGLAIEAVATSLASERLAVACGIAVRSFEAVAEVDLTIDGADEVDARLRAVKGAGGAMLREKAVAAASRRMVVVADGSKRVASIGAARVPVEILPFATGYVLAALAQIGGRPVVRDGYLTDNGHRVADCRFGTVEPERLAAMLAQIPGILGHGLFLHEVDAAYICDAGVVTRLERHPSPR